MNARQQMAPPPRGWTLTNFLRESIEAGCLPNFRLAFFGLISCFGFGAAKCFLRASWCRDEGRAIYLFLWGISKLNSDWEVGVSGLSLLSGKL